MKLTQEQIQKIENYLDYKKLEQVDLRYEVQDHMIVGIEQALEEGISFKEAFNQQKEKWNPELESYSSWWLGPVNDGPKIMIKKCVTLAKEVSLVGILISSILYSILSFIPYDFSKKSFHSYIAFTFFIAFMISLALSYKMRQSNLKSTYKHFYKTQDVGYLIVLVFFGLIIGFDFSFFSKEVSFYETYISVMLYVNVFYSFKINKKHNNVIKQMIA